MPTYGTLNETYIASWFERADPGGPMWALNLMHYKAVAEYTDGRDSSLTGIEADDAYAPIDQLKAVGARIILLAPVLHQLVGDDTTWDRIAIAQYPYRTAIVEMDMRKDFQETHAHKEAGMESTIVMATFPAETDTPPQVSAAGSDDLLLLQVVADHAESDFADEVESTRIGRFEVEDRIVGDDRTFAEARYDLVSREVADELADRPMIRDDANYVVVADPSIDDVARSLTDPTQVLF